MPKYIKTIILLFTVLNILNPGIFISGAEAQETSTSYLVQQFQRKARVGMGKNPPIGTLRYPQAIKDGETIVIFADGFDADGDFVFVSWYVNGKLFTTQSESPYGVRIGPDIYKNTPVRITVEVRNDHGDSSVARVAITSTAFAKSYSCTFTLDDTTLTVEEATTTQVGNSGITISMKGSQNGDSILINSTLILSGSKATGDLTLTTNSTTQSFNVSGTVTFNSDGIAVNSLSVEDTDSGAKLSCT